MNLEKLLKLYIEKSEELQKRKDKMKKELFLPLSYFKPSTTKACQNSFCSHKKIFNQKTLTESASVNDILGGMWIPHN